jgi:hypothetical protein
MHDISVSAYLRRNRNGEEMTKDAPGLPKFYFCPEVATELRRTEAAVRWLWSTGALKSRIVGGRRVSTAEDLAEFFAGSSSERTSTAAAV